MNFSSSRIASVVLGVILVALIAAGGVYAYQKSHDNEVVKESPTSSSSSMSPTPQAEEGSETYSNTALGFSLTLGEVWEGYKAEENKDGSIGFSVPTVKPLDAGGNYTTDEYAQIFSISRLSVGVYDQNKLEGLPVGTEVYRDSTYVFVRDKRLDSYPANLKNKITEDDIKAVINSFKRL